MNILITGASKGIGLGLKKKFESHGHNVISWSTSEGVDCRYAYDVRKALLELPELDILVNNAGVFYPDSFLDIKVRNLDNLFIPLNITTQVIKSGKLHRNGLIVNILSTDIYDGPNSCNGGYYVSKCAFEALGYLMKGSLTQGVLNLYPSTTDTDLLDKHLPLPKGRIRTIEETVGILFCDIMRYRP